MTGLPGLRGRWLNRCAPATVGGERGRAAAQPASLGESKERLVSRSARPVRADGGTGTRPGHRHSGLGGPSPHTPLRGGCPPGSPDVTLKRLAPPPADLLGPAPAGRGGGLGRLLAKRANGHKSHRVTGLGRGKRGCMRHRETGNRKRGTFASSGRDRSSPFAE